MRIVEAADFVVGDTGLNIDITTDIDMTDMDLEIIVVKPSGNTFTKDVTSISDDGYTANYTLVAGDLDEDGEHMAFLRSKDEPYEFKPSKYKFTVRPKAEDMAKW